MKLNNLWGLFGRKKKKIEELEDTITDLKEDYEKASKAVKAKDLELFDKMVEIDNLSKKNKKLTKDYDELQKKYEESMTNKYRVRKIPEGKTPQQQKIRSNAKGVSLQTRRRLEETSELRGI